MKVGVRMLPVIIPSLESWDEKEECFNYEPEVRLELEHSLLSISKWESNWHIPFYGIDHKTIEQTIDYIKCMSLNKEISDEVYYRLSPDNYNSINDYINNNMTATWFREDNNNRKHSAKIITSELIYYWMIMYNIPIECENWHINKLLTLIKVCNEENKPPKKMSRAETLKQYASINAARRRH